MSFYCQVSLEVAQGHLLSGIYRNQHSWSQGLPLLQVDVLSWGRGGSFTSGHRDGHCYRSLLEGGCPGSAPLLRAGSLCPWWEPIPAPLQAPGKASPPCPSPGLVQELCHSRNLVWPSDRFVIQLVTARRGRVTNEHIQGLQPLIESVHNWEFVWVRHSPCTNRDLTFKKPWLPRAAEEEQLQCPVQAGSSQWHPRVRPSSPPPP